MLTVVAVILRADRRDDVVLGQAFAVADGQVLHAPVRVMHQTGELFVFPAPDGQLGAASRQRGSHDPLSIGRDAGLCIRPPGWPPSRPRRLDIERGLIRAPQRFLRQESFKSGQKPANYHMDQLRPRGYVYSSAAGDPGLTRRLGRGNGCGFGSPWWR